VLASPEKGAPGLQGKKQSLKNDSPVQGKRSAYFAHRCEFVPISRLVGNDLRLPEVSVGWKPFF